MPALRNHLRLPLARRFQQSILTISNRATPTLQKAWDNLPGYDESSVGHLTEATAGTLAAAKTAAFNTSSGFYATLSGGKAPGMNSGLVTVEPQMRDPFIATWRALKQGLPYVAAVQAGRLRLDAVAANFTNSTARQTGDLFVEKAGLQHNGWERITDAKACDWCHLVAQQTYKSADSADFGHDRCGCTAIPRL